MSVYNGWDVRPRVSRMPAKKKYDPAIDIHITEEERDVLYSKWADTWMKPFVFQGGVKSITAKHILSVPYKELTRQYGVRFAVRIHSVAEAVGGN